MSPTRARYITACQQLLALGVVLAALTPATSVVSLDIVRDTPEVGSGNTVEGELAAYTRATSRPSRSTNRLPSGIV